MKGNETEEREWEHKRKGERKNKTKQGTTAKQSNTHFVPQHTNHKMRKKDRKAKPEQEKKR